MNRVFTWGFGGYGRNGHNNGDDEHRPRELTFFSRPTPQQQVRKICAGGTFSCAVTESSSFYFWGKLPNSPRGEAMVYPRMQQELYNWNVNCIAAGSSFVVVSSHEVCIGWGVPVAGKFGLEGDVRGSSVPKFVDRVKHLRTLDICCGYGHVAFVVDSTNSALAQSTLDDCPELTAPAELVGPVAKEVKRAGGSSSAGEIALFVANNSTSFFTFLPFYFFEN